MGKQNQNGLLERKDENAWRKNKKHSKSLQFCAEDLMLLEQLSCLSSFSEIVVSL